MTWDEIKAQRAATQTITPVQKTPSGLTWDEIKAQRAATQTSTANQERISNPLETAPAQAMKWYVANGMPQTAYGGFASYDEAAKAFSDISDKYREQQGVEVPKLSQTDYDSKASDFDKQIAAKKAEASRIKAELDRASTLRIPGNISIAGYASRAEAEKALMMANAEAGRLQAQKKQLETEQYGNDIQQTADYVKWLWTRNPDSPGGKEFNWQTRGGLGLDVAASSPKVFADTIDAAVTGKQAENSWARDMLNNANAVMAEQEQGMGSTTKALLHTGDSIRSNLFNIFAGNVGGAITGVAPTANTTLALMGIQSAGQQAETARQAGATPVQQLASGAIAGALEIATEKLPMDALFDVAKASGKQGVVTILKNTLKQAGLEAPGEYINQFAGNIANEAIYEHSVGKNETLGEFLKRTNNESLKAGLQGFIQGVAMGGGTAVVNSMQNVSGNKATALEKAPTNAQTQHGNTITTPTQNVGNTANILNQETKITPTQESVGAATTGFDQMAGLVGKYGAIPAGKGNITTERIVELPKRTSDDMKLSQTVRTALEAPATPNNTARAVEDATLAERFSYEVNTDKGALDRAEQSINYKGFENALKDWTAEVRSGKVSKDLSVLGQVLYNSAANQGNLTEAVDILVDLVNMQCRGAQATQAVSIFKKLSPAYQLYAIERSVQHYQAELVNKYGDRAPNLKIDEAAAAEFLNAQTEEEKQAAQTKIYKQIASQVPNTFADKWNAWRYIAMLTNPRTHIRNIVGNALFMPPRMIKNAVAAGIERVAGIQSRTKAVLNPLSKSDRALLDVAWKDYPSVSEQITQQGKYDDALSQIEKERRIFNSRLLEGTRRAGTAALDVEDVWFAQIAYAESLASYLKANGITAEQYANKTIPQREIDKAQAYAVKEAQKATYRDSNAFSDFVSRLGRNYHGNNKVAKAANVLVEGALPFKRTPANILARGIEYSPVGLIKGITYDLAQVKNDKITAAEAIDHISSGLSGTGILAMGVYFASQGLIAGGEPDDEKQAGFDKLQGIQPYSLRIGNGTYTIDWAVPASIPFFMGVALFNKATDDSKNGLTLNEILKTVQAVADPALETSMLSGLDDVISGAAYAKQRGESGIGYVVAQLALNYLSQAVPTLLGQIARTIDPVRRTVYTDKNSGIPTDLQYFLQKNRNKIPGLSTMSQPYIDAWGRTDVEKSLSMRAFENFVSPGYLSTVNTSPMETELQRLYDQGYGQSPGETVLPTMANKSFTVNGNEYALSGAEYEKYAKLRGQTAYSELTKLTASKDYKAMTDTEKVKAITDVFKSANEKSKQFIVEARGEMYLDSYGQKKVDTYKSLGLNEKASYELYKKMSALKPLAGAGGITDKQRIDTVMAQSYTVPQKAKIIGNLYGDNSLLAKTSNAGNLISAYRTTGESAYINMTVPDKFSEDKVEYVLTASEKDTYEKTFLKTYEDEMAFWKRYDALGLNTVSAETWQGRLSDAISEAKKAAKQAVIDGR